VDVSVFWVSDSIMCYASLWLIVVDYLGRLMYSISTFACRLIYSRECLFITCVIGNMRFLNFHGQPEARLNRDQSVYGDRTNRRTWFISSISIVLFSAPDVHLKTLQKMWVDGILHKTVWEQSLKKVTDEWREFILYVSHETKKKTTVCT